MPRQYVHDEDWEAQGRTLMHVYPATLAPAQPEPRPCHRDAEAAQYNVLAQHGPPGGGHDLRAPHPVARPAVGGSNVGDLYVVTEDGFENLSCHTPLETFRVKVE